LRFIGGTASHLWKTFRCGAESSTPWPRAANSWQRGQRRAN